MLLFKTIQRLLECVTRCRHLRTQIHEGKCYCPDCGSGLIYRWVVLRCGFCQIRRDSHPILNEIVPNQKYCPGCGEQHYVLDYLDSPSYFQIHKAQLLVEEESHSYRPPQWIQVSMATTWMQWRSQAGWPLSPLPVMGLLSTARTS